MIEINAYTQTYPGGSSSLRTRVETPVQQPTQQTSVLASDPAEQRPAPSQQTQLQTFSLSEAVRSQSASRGTLLDISV